MQTPRDGSRFWSLRNSKEAVAREARELSGGGQTALGATGRTWGFSCNGSELRVWDRVTGAGLCSETALAAGYRTD